jgi:hypothetical protein
MLVFVIRIVCDSYYVGIGHRAPRWFGGKSPPAAPRGVGTLTLHPVW